MQKMQKLKFGWSSPKSCQYIDSEVFITLIKQSQDIGKLINYMVSNPERFK